MLQDVARVWLALAPISQHNLTVFQHVALKCCVRCIVDIGLHSHKTRYATQGNLYRTFIQSTANLCLDIRQFKRGKVSHHTQSPLLNLLLEISIKYSFFPINDIRCHSRPSD